MSHIEVLTRRAFLGNLVTSGAFVIAARFTLPGARAADVVPPAESATWSPSVYLGIERDGTVILVTHRSEMGTGIRSVLPQVLAEELEVDWNRVKIEQAVGDSKYGSQNTDGSCSIRDFYDIMRQVGASARTLLERAAAAKWGVPVSECKALNHQVVHSGGRRLDYGELAADAAKLSAPKPEELKFKSPADYRYVGKALPTIDVADLCSGKGVFGIDATMPGMVHAAIERSPVFGGTLKSYDAQDARAVNGVQQIVVLPPLEPPYGFKPLGGIAVIANSTWAAQQGRAKLKVEWGPGENASYDSTRYKQELLKTVRQPQKAARTIGDVDAEFAKARKTFEAEYYVPHLSHAPMEPPAAVAEVRNGKARIYAATQNPQAVQETVAAALGIDRNNVECHVTLLGGGFGRKSKPDYVAEAALLSRAVGKPVKVTWSREEDIRFDYYHAVAAMYLKAALDAQGKPTAWLQRSAFPSIGAMFDPSTSAGQPFELGMGWSNLPFAIPNHRAENGPAQAHVRIGWLRSVSNIYHAFAIHSFADELAALENRDRVEYLLELLGPSRQIDLGERGPNAEKFPLNTGRFRRVIELAAEKSEWAKKPAIKGRALGIAAHWSFYSYVAAVVEVEVDDAGKIRIPRVDIAADVGTVINPDRVKSQFEGASVFGASLALFGEITAANGAIVESNFDDYRIARIHEAPIETHVHLVSSNEPPAGVGEPGVPPMAPALCNAIFAATGRRIRDLPIRRHKLNA